MALTHEEKLNFCIVIGTLMVADLKLHDAEVVYLENLYQRLGITEREREEIESAIDLRTDTQALARALSPAARRDLLYELQRAAWCDGVLVQPEIKIIRKIEELLEEEG